MEMTIGTDDSWERTLEEERGSGGRDRGTASVPGLWHQIRLERRQERLREGDGPAEGGAAGDADGEGLTLPDLGCL